MRRHPREKSGEGEQLDLTMPDALRHSEGAAFAPADGAAVADAVVRREAALARYFAFLRAINVGGRTVRMESLRSAFAALGFSAVETFIASGNVIFESCLTNEELLRKKLERHLARTLGYEVATFIRSPAELNRVASYPAFRLVPNKATGHSILVAFLSASPSPEASKNLIACRSETDEFQVRNREIYWLCRARLGDSRFSGARLEKIVGMRATLRNLTTIKRLAAKYRE